MEAEKRGETGTLWNGSDKENKRCDTRYNTSCDRSHYETFPCLLNLRDRHVCETQKVSERGRETETERQNDSMCENQK